MKNIALTQTGQGAGFLAKVQNSVSNFLNSENTLFSLMMEEKVSNRQALYAGNLSFAFTATIVTSCITMSLMWISLIWLATAAFQLIKSVK